MRLWKFIISPSGAQAPDGAIWFGVVAVVVSETAEQARLHLERYAIQNGFDARWLSVARVVELPIAEGTVGTWAEL